MWVFIDGKTLCEILTVADAMLLLMSGSRVDDNLSGMTLCGCPFNGAATAPIATRQNSCRV